MKGEKFYMFYMETRRKGRDNCNVTHLLISDMLSNNQHYLKVLLNVILLVVTTKLFNKQEGNIK